MTGLRRSLGTFEAFVVSLSIIAPTLAMAFNVTLAVHAAGRAAPLSFLIGGAIMALIGLSFVAFARHIASAGSAYSYVDAVFGRRWAFLVGWGLLLAYLAFLGSATSLIGGFLAAGLAHAGVSAPILWLGISAVGAGLVIWLGGREIRRATLLMAAIEVMAVLAIMALAAIILTQVPLSTAPFRPDPVRGVTGVGYGVVFAVLSFAGFEGAATVAEETRDPHRAIPVAIIGSAIVATLLYTFVTYAQVLGYGLDQVQALGETRAPLDALSSRYISESYGTFLDVAAGVSSIACALGSASAAARLLYVLGRNGMVGGFAAIEPTQGVPRRAVRAVGVCNLVALAMFGSWTGASGYSEALSTIGTLALILVYISVGLAQMVDAGRRQRRAWCLVGALGAALLLWPLSNSLYPVPAWPANLWPLVVCAWMIGGLVLSRIRSAGLAPPVLEQRS